MPRGGKRVGAGRKNGSGTGKTSKTNELAMKAAGEGAMPLEVLLKAMRIHYAEERWDKAAEIAGKAAPYCHPRLSAVAIQDMTPKEESEEAPVREVIVRTREEAERLLALSEAGGLPGRS